MKNKITILSLLTITLIMGSCNKETYEGINQAHCNLDFTNHVNQQKYQDVLDQFSQKGIVGLTVIIDKSGQENWTGSSGYASIEENIKMKNCNLHQTASLVKSFVGISTLQLIDTGLLDFDTAIGQHLPSEILKVIPDLENLTIEQLLNHTSGLEDIFGLNFIADFMNNPGYSYTRKELLSYVTKAKRVNDPGEAHYYSDTNYILLSFIIDTIRGDFITDMRENIFVPLNLNDTYYHNDSYPNIDGLPQSYWEQYHDGNIENISQLQKRVTNYIKGSDGIIASPRDMVTFYKSIFEGSLISESLKEAILKNKVVEPIDFKMNTGYSYGLMTIEENGQTWVGHVGSQLGTSCFVFYNVDTQDCVGVFTNTGTFLFTEKQQLIYGELWEAIKIAMQ